MRLFLETLFLLGVGSLLELVTSVYFSSRWSLRGMIFFDTKNRAGILLRILFYVLIGGFFGSWYQDIFAGVAFTAIAWLSVLVIFTDLKYCRIPSGACWTSFGITIMMISFTIIFNDNKVGFLSAIVALLSVIFSGGLLALTTKGKFGSGDVRLMFTLSILATWSGYMAILVGLILASFIQLPLRVILRKCRKSAEIGLPFAPALIIGTLISILFFGDPGQPFHEFGFLIHE